MLEEENRELKRKRSIEAHRSPQPVRDTSNFSTDRLTLNEMSSSLSRGLSQQTGEPIHLANAKDNPSNALIDTPNDSSISKDNPDEVLIQPRYLGEASSETFGKRLHQYVNHGERLPSSRSYSYFKHPKLLRTSCAECSLPNKNYARLLVRAVLRFIGGDHHLLLKKSFLQRLDETYQLEVLDDPVWLCRLFTVLALGELYSARGAQGIMKGTGVPGTEFFVKAMGYFSDIHEEPTIAYIETLLILVSIPHIRSRCYSLLV